MSLRGVLLAAIVAGCPGSSPGPEPAPPPDAASRRAAGGGRPGTDRSPPATEPPADAAEASAPSPAEGVRCTFEAAGDALVLVVANSTSAPVEIPDPEDPGAVRWFAGDRLVSAAVPGRPPRTRVLDPGRTLRVRHGRPGGVAVPNRARLEAPTPAVALDCTPSSPALP